MPHEGGKKDMKTWKKRKRFEDKCCNRKHIFNCNMGIGVNSKILFRNFREFPLQFQSNQILNQENITIHGIPFKYKRNVSPHAYVFVTENNEEALLYYNNKVRRRGRLRGSFDLKDGRSFAFEECLVQCKLFRQYNYMGKYKYPFSECTHGYIFYQFNQTSLRSKDKENVIIIEKNNTNSLPHRLSGKSEKEYSIMFYYTWKFDKKFFGRKRDFFEELVHKTNQEYHNNNISIKARMHCFEKARVWEKNSNNMSEILEQFRKMKGSPEKLRNLADVAVLLINDVKDSCGASYGHAYRNGWTFSVVSRDCAISQLTFSHGIAHNFGAGHSSGYILNKTNRGFGEEGKNSRQEFVSTQQNGLPSLKTSHYTNSNIIHPVMKTGRGKFGMPTNFMYFSKHIDKISVLGNESCVCYKAYAMLIEIKAQHMKLNESCNFHLNLANQGTNYSNILMFHRRTTTEKTDQTQDKRNPSTHADLHKYFLDDRQNLFKNYIKAVQELYETYLRDAHSKIHEHGYNYVHLLGNGD